ncbi:tRNA (cytosine(34)-C(5))-methyltransferase, mitochondrial [Oryzias melastigma]|uniref:tRNA (cytosine(34)-C(5))-methyltransferase, mitochondrial n=1 Tax=Oryzias melastigma TaxID=30732 RepID=UPI000CF8100A|nr:tRNA (cytosine(34)-C(5))-methyltransferase, mitochondrial [Oryzias melastigma]
MRKIIRFTPLLPKPVWKLCSCRCHTGSEAAVQQSEGGGQIQNKIKKKCQRKRPSCPAVLDHFDRQYGEELGELWTSARTALLDPRSWQYGVMLNRFSVLTDITQKLQSQGFSALLPQTNSSASLCANNPSSTEERDLMLTPHELHHYLQSKPSLQCYIHPLSLRFPSQAHRPGRLKQYYLINAASLLPVLALQVRDEDRVLDLCSAPGGKAVAIMQSATPAFLCCNEPDPHRREWLTKTLESFLPHCLSSRVTVSGQDGRLLGQTEAGFYDKVLVDAPCSNDRSWLYSSSIQQGAQRLKDREKLPLIQAQLLRSALSAVRPGGVVVYSTCTLSSYENWAVVEKILEDFPQAEPEDLWEEIAFPLSNYFTFSPPPNQKHAHPKKYALTLDSTRHHRLGLLVVPQNGKMWGPMFVSRIRRKE